MDGICGAVLLALMWFPAIRVAALIPASCNSFAVIMLPVVLPQTSRFEITVYVMWFSLSPDC